MRRTLYLHSFPFHEARRWTGRPVVTPNPRAARALGAPPLTLETLAARALEDGGLHLARPLTASRLLRQAVAEAGQLEDSDGASRVLGPTVRELFRSDLNLTDLSVDSCSRVAFLGRVALRYRQLLRGNSLVDPSEALLTAAACKPERQELYFYGYARFGAGERAFIDAVSGAGSEIVLASADASLFRENRETAQHFANQGWQVEAGSGDPESTGDQLARRFLNDAGNPGNLQALVYPHQEAEIRGTLARIKVLLSAGVLPVEIALVARDDAECGPLVIAVAQEYGVPIRALYAVPLRETRVGAWLELLLEALTRGFAFESTLRLFGHPLGPGLSAAQRGAAHSQRPSDCDAWAAVGVDLALLRWPEKASPAEYVQLLRALLETLEIRRRAARWASELLAVGQLWEGLEELVVVGPPVPLLNFLNELREALSILTTPAHPGRGGVELHTPLSLFGARYRHLFVIGAAEGCLPAAITDDPVLDFHDRRRLEKFGFHLEGAAEAARRETLSFYTLLLATIEQLTLSYSQFSGREQLPSAYFPRLGVQPRQPDPAPACSLEEARGAYLRREAPLDDPGLPEVRHAFSVEQRRESALPPDEYDGIVGLSLDPESRIFSALQFTHLGQCPFHWFSGYVLRLREAEETEELLDPGRRGNLLHLALQYAVEPALESPEPRTRILQGLDEAFQRAERELRLTYLPAWPARRTELLEQLRRAVRAPDFINEGARIIRVESTFTGNWQGFRVTGRIDRIDRTDGALVLVDYKSGGQLPAGLPDAEGRLRLDIQLPLYCEVAAPQLYPGASKGEAHYFSLSTAGRIKSFQDTPLLERFAGKVRERLHSGDYPVAPDPGQRACEYCEFDLVCRRGARLTRKGIDPCD